MVYFNDVNDLKRLEAALINLKKSEEQPVITKEAENLKEKHENDNENESRKKLKV